MENNNPVNSWRSPKVILSLVGLILVAGIVTVAILRDRLVSPPQWQVSVTGQGKVSYQPDIAIVSLGVQIDKAASAEVALRNLNQRTEKIITAVKKRLLFHLRPPLSCRLCLQRMLSRAPLSSFGNFSCLRLE